MRTKIQVEVFVATQLLGQSLDTFTTDDLRLEIKERFGDTRPGVNTHISAHCVANAPRNAVTVYNYLWRLRPAQFRPFHPVSDRPHATRVDAAAVPRIGDIPVQYRYLVTQGG